MSFSVKTPTLKLFGKTIPVNQSSFISDLPRISHLSASQNSSQPQLLRSATSYLETSEDDEDRGRHEQTTTSSSFCEVSRKRSVERETSGEKETSTEAKKTLKKPDKLLPCPRCNSKRTKFCYYNNYNVNQPRHFCKNCQRYWTAGGTMRTVTVGAGRRKSKNSTDLPHPRTLVSVTGSNPPEKEIKMSNQEQTVEKFEPFRPQFQSPFCSSPGFPLSYYSFPFWGCTGPSSWTNSAELMEKSLRNDDLDEAEKSFINDGKLFSGFRSKRDEESVVQTSPLLLQANPAALSRSVKFHERSWQQK